MSSRFSLRAALSRHHTPTAAIWQRNPGARRAYVLIAAWSLYAGAALAFGRPERTSGPSYIVIRQVGGPHWIGYVLIALAAVLVVAPAVHMRVMRVALIVAAALHVLLALSFGGSARADIHAGLLAPGIYVIAVLWCISNAELYRTDR